MAAKRQKKGNSTRPLPTWKSYLFREKDPIMDAVATARSDANMSYVEIEKAGGPKAATLRNWEHGTVQRPQFGSISAAIISVGGNGVVYGKDGRPRITRGPRR